MGYKERFRKKFPDFSLTDPLQKFYDYVGVDPADHMPSEGYKVTLHYDYKGHIKDITFERIH